MSNYTLFDLVYRTMREMGTLIEGTATGGSTSTVADTVDRTEADDTYNGGTILVTYDAGGAGAAPQGEYDQVSDFANTSGVISARTGWTVAVAAGDRYAVAKKKYSLAWVKQCINRALQNLGEVPVTDTTTITTADGQTEYSLPATPLDLREVYIQNNNDDSDDNQWTPLHNCKEGVTATGTANLLILPYQPVSGYAIKLVYGANHPELVNASDKLSEEVPIERVVYAAASIALMDKAIRIDPMIMTRINNLDDKDAKAAAFSPIRNLPAKTARIILAYDFTDRVIEDEPNKVYL
jgi:hypothetical protein